MTPFRTRRHRGRGVTRLVADFGHQLPPLTAPEERSVEPDLWEDSVGRHGRQGRASGWSPVPAPLTVFRMTSEQVGGVWPLIAGDGLPPGGALLGIDHLSGGDAIDGFGRETANGHGFGRLAPQSPSRACAELTGEG